jgi:hypothetical protein
MEVLFILLVFLGIVTLVGHGIWLVLAFIFRSFLKAGEQDHGIIQDHRIITAKPGPEFCGQCGAPMHLGAPSCARCGWRKPSSASAERLAEIAAALRSLQRHRQKGNISQEAFDEIATALYREREELTSLQQPVRERPRPPVPGTVIAGNVGATEPKPVQPIQPPSVVDAIPPVAPITATEKSADTPSPMDVIVARPPSQPFTTPVANSWIQPDSERSAPRREPIPRKPRRPFSEVLAAFMEQSNIRWGEIIGGLLIVGCSTALVISLWNEISSIPVMKFFIFTTVTAALFGVGLYTEHRWKLPTTSRGILTIATLLVPLNFLAIAAVTKETTATSTVVIAGELFAPALFFCLVYFAGRIITRAWPHLLVFGVLGASVGQLLIRHFAFPQMSTTRLLALGAFTIACYAVSMGWMFRRAAREDEFDEGLSNTIFLTLSAATFSVMLSLGLLIFRSGSKAESVMHLAPLLTLGGGVVLMVGLLLWHRIKSSALNAARAAGTSIAVLGAIITLAGIVLSFPNPASVVLACGFAFVIFTVVAVSFDEPRLQIAACATFALGFVVAFLAFTGQVEWQAERQISLLRDLVSARSGQAMALVFVILLVVSEWWRRRANEASARYYLWSGAAAGAVCLALVAVFRIGTAVDEFYFGPILTVLTAGAFWIAWRSGSRVVAWIASGVMLLTIVQVFQAWLPVRFPWQAASLLHASVAAVAAIVLTKRGGSAREIFVKPLNNSAITSSVLAVLFLVAAYRWQSTELYASRLLWLASVWLVLLRLNLLRPLFAAMQVAFTASVLLATKLALQNYDWYGYVPNAWLDPRSLQVYGSVLALLCLFWAGLRLVLGKQVKAAHGAKETTSTRSELIYTAWHHLNAPGPVFDRLASAGLVVGLFLLSIYAAANGLKFELTIRGGAASFWNFAGFAHEHAYGIGAWVLLTLLLLVMAAGYWQRRGFNYLVGLVVVAFAGVPLLAANWERQFAAASAWRWFVVGFFILLSLPLWLKEKLRRGIGVTGDASFTDPYDRLSRTARRLLLLLTVPSLFALTLYPVLKAIWYRPVHGPESGFFFQIGTVASYSIPLVLFAIALFVFAVRERAVGHAFAAGLVANLAVTVAQVLAIAAVGGSMNRVVLLQVLQLNAIASAALALVWIATRGWWLRNPSTSESIALEKYVKIQIGLAAAMIALPIVSLVFWIFVSPTGAGLATVEAGGVRGWLAVLLSIAAVFWRVKVFDRQLNAWKVFFSLAAISAVSAFVAVGMRPGTWVGFHALMAAAAATGGLMLLAATVQVEDEIPPSPNFTDIESSSKWFRLSPRWKQDAAIAVMMTAVWIFLLALRASPADPIRPWWSFGGLLVVAGLAVGLNLQAHRRGYLYFAGLSLNLATTIWIITKWPSENLVRGFFEVGEANIVVLALPGIAWLILELRSSRLFPDRKPMNPAFHHVAAILSLAALAFLIGIAVLLALDALTFGRYVAIEWLAIGSVGALMFACLWDARARYATAGLYLTGMIAVAAALLQADLAPRSFVWAMMLAMAGYALVTSAIGRSRGRLARLADQLKMPNRTDPALPSPSWLKLFNLLVAIAVVGLAVWSVLAVPHPLMRLAGGLAVMAQLFSFGMIADGELRPAWQRLAIASLAIGIVLLGWAWLQPGITATWLNRAVVVMIVMFGMIALSGFGLDRGKLRDSDWLAGAQSLVPMFAIYGAVALIFVLVTEVVQQSEYGGVRAGIAASLVVGATLIGGCVLFILFAVRPSHDPLKLSESGRMKYVYVAEVLLALFFVHIRLTMPWMFSGFFAKYWPIAIVFISFVGVGVAEALRRQGVMVVARPVERTGVLLPLLPVIGFWIVDSRVDYSVVLFMIGLLYASLSILRRSFAFGILAALAGNGGLWYMLQRSDSYGVLQHPQMWLIPIALSVLIASYLNRERFTEEQMTGIRYITLMVIYVSSTSDILINGVAESPWLPLALAGLSLVGVLAGVMFRIRAFLFLGSTFMLIAVISMIWYASVNLGWTWLWYVAGIAMGVLIIFTFALFEKKRAEMLRVIEDLRAWER